MTTAFRRTAERRNKRVWWPLSPAEMSAKRIPFRLIAPLYEELTAYLAKKWTFATPGPTWAARSIPGVAGCMSFATAWCPGVTSGSTGRCRRLSAGSRCRRGRGEPACWQRQGRHGTTLPPTRRWWVRCARAGWCVGSTLKRSCDAASGGRCSRSPRLSAPQSACASCGSVARPHACATPPTSPPASRMASSHGSRATAARRCPSAVKRNARSLPRWWCFKRGYRLK